MYRVDVAMGGLWFVGVRIGDVMLFRYAGCHHFDRRIDFSRA